jgi:hypothetical protein
LKNDKNPNAEAQSGSLSSGEGWGEVDLGSVTLIILQKVIYSLFLSHSSLCLPYVEGSVCSANRILKKPIPAKVFGHKTHFALKK